VCLFTRCEAYLLDCTYVRRQFRIALSANTDMILNASKSIAEIESAHGIDVFAQVSLLTYLCYIL
jgi:hypothetical protein